MSHTTATTGRAADWDMTPYFSAMGAEDYQSFCRSLDEDIDSLAAELEAAPTLDATSALSWAERLARLEQIHARAGHLGSYYDCMGSADATDEAIKRDTARYAATAARIDKLFVSVRAQLGAASDAAFDALLACDLLEGSAHFLRRLRIEAKTSMEESLESLSADLGVDGISAWGRLYDQLSGTLSFELKRPDGSVERLPVAMTRTFLEDADPAVRQAAFEGSNAAWESVGDTVAACLNAIAGTRHTLYARRGIEHFLEPALFDAAIDRATLDCMLEVVRSRQELPRKFLVKKAALLDQERLGFCDLMAPLGSGSSERVPWERGVGLIDGAFQRAYPALASFAQMAVSERWIDHSPRPGKRPGGFCSGSDLIGQSRIFMTYNGALGDVQTLAHELGHAVHSHLMREMRPWAVHYPMTLAETASTFAENLVTNAALESEQTSDDARMSILDQRLQDAAAFLLNIPTRFDFEVSLYEARKKGELGVSELQELMLAAQRKNYGDALDPDRLDPWFWASKLHFYITELSFYNFPYTFGYLFSMGIFARFLAEGESFLPRYEELLRLTGSAPAEEVAQRALGVDLQAPAFWNASIDVIEKDWEQFSTLVSN
jgi:oligoendopeptidase F